MTNDGAWQPMEDADYPPNTSIRVKYADGTESVGFVSVTDLGAEWVPVEIEDRPWPTHWMPLPSPPATAPESTAASA